MRRAASIAAGRPGGDKPFDVVGLGLASIDHLCVVNRHPRFDSKQEIVTYDVQPGGQVPTALVALQRWGLRTAYVGSFGDDAGAEMSRSALALDGVDVTAAVRRPNTAQQVAVILIDAISGERSVLWHRVDDLVLRHHELPFDALGRGRVLLMDAVDLPAALAAARAAKSAGALVVLDTDTPAPGIEELLHCTDLLIVGAGYLERLTGRAELRAALRAAAALGPWWVAVTLGPGGVLALVDGRFHFVPAFRVPVVDSTGAGDIFHAGAIYGVLQGWRISDTLRFAAAAAALKCAHLGGRPGIPTVEGACRLAEIGYEG